MCVCVYPCVCVCLQCACAPTHAHSYYQVSKSQKSDLRLISKLLNGILAMMITHRATPAHVRHTTECTLPVWSDLLFRSVVVDVI